jgi:hypothetical protein
MIISSNHRARKTSLVKANLQDMLLQHIVVFGRAAAAAGRRHAIVHLDGYKRD